LFEEEKIVQPPETVTVAGKKLPVKPDDGFEFNPGKAAFGPGGKPPVEPRPKPKPKPKPKPVAKPKPKPKPTGKREVVPSPEKKLPTELSPAETRKAFQKLHNELNVVEEELVDLNSSYRYAHSSALERLGERKRYEKWQLKIERKQARPERYQKEYGPTLARLEGEIKRAMGATRYARWQRLSVKQSKLIEENRKAAERYLFLPEEERKRLRMIRKGGMKGGPKYQRRAEEAGDWFNKVTHKDASPPWMTHTTGEIKSGSRSFQRAGRIFMSSSAETRVYVHELAHALEFRDKRWAAKAQAFLRKRTKGEKLRKLEELHPDRGYGSDEVTKPDKFFHPYCGKYYVHGKGAVLEGEMYATEILSMGMEQMYVDPVGFAAKDPGHFELVLSLLRGTP
jgi:hypothetical protein